jgi:hypothetical protein
MASFRCDCMGCVFKALNAVIQKQRDCSIHSIATIDMGPNC